MTRVIGIDLGTTNSVAAARDEFGRPVVIPNREGKNVTPSVIRFGPGEPIVGDEAKDLARLGDDRIASFFKPHMGNPNFRLSFDGRHYSATDLSALVLARLKADAQARLGETIASAVITVPAYFADPQRTAAIEAGRLAGLDVKRIINEPTAAALAYGMQKTDRDETVLIYDLGGGTFDVTLARIDPATIFVLSTAGDHDLGGKNWDDRLAQTLAEKFAAETGIDLLDNPLALNELLVRAEQAKWTLSERNAARVTLQFEALRRSYEISRAEFEAMTFSLMDRTRRLTEEAIEEAKLGWNDITGVLLVGGSTRMPMVRAYVTQMAGKPPKGGVNVDEAVALGAAMQAMMEEGAANPESAVPKFTLAGAKRISDVMSHSLGVVAVNAEGSAYINDIVIRRNLPVPAANVKPYMLATAGGNDRLEVYLTQGESASPLDCSILGKYVFSGVEPTAADVAVDIEMSYDANGVVQVRARQRDTGQALAMSIDPVPDDLSWLEQPPEIRRQSRSNEKLRIYLLIDVSSSMDGEPLEEAKAAAREFLARCDFTATEVGLIAFSNEVTLQAEATDNPRKLHAAVARLEAGGSTNLADALALANEKLVARDRLRYVVMLTDGYPDAPGSAVEESKKLREAEVELVAIGTGEADEYYLKKLASGAEASIFARQGELVSTFGHIARVISEGGRGLRTVS